MALKQHQADRYDFEDPDESSGSLALYAWAGIAALSALTACFTVLVPVAEPPGKLVEKPASEVLKPVEVARTPDIVPPKEVPRPAVVAVTQKPALKDEEVDKLLEKYREKTEEIDCGTTAAVPGEIANVSLEDTQPAQSFPGDDAVGATIGWSKSVPALAQRYAALQRRAPDLFESIDPLVEVVESGDRLEARLIAGPFSEQQELADFCRALKLRMTIDCVAGEYSGEPIAR